MSERKVCSKCYDRPFFGLRRFPEVGDRVIELYRNGEPDRGTITKVYVASNGYPGVRVMPDVTGGPLGFNLCNYGSTWQFEEDTEHVG